MVAAQTHAFGQTGIALAFGLVVTIIVASAGVVGGVHINPAVSVGLWSIGRFPSRHLAPYIVAQCIGAICASAMLRWLLGDVGDLGATVPIVTLTRAFVIEAGFTALLGFVIMSVAVGEHVGDAAPFVLGATVFAGALVTGPLTGGSFNPARSLGPALVGSHWQAHWIYWLAPIAGMLIGMRLHDVLRPACSPIED